MNYNEMTANAKIEFIKEITEIYFDGTISAVEAADLIQGFCGNELTTDEIINFIYKEVIR